ncbi:TPA: hypothetical protein HA265_08565 [Candidatus Woesearchaeota archaeon]|nr:hypothetical protein [Candidatus Woesearchaeota archaeon]
MEINIKKERETPLLARKRYIFEIVKEGTTPSRKEIINMVSSKLKSDPKLTVIKHVYPRYGVQKTRVVAHIYNNETDMKRFEMEGLLKKHVKEEKKEEAAAQ